MQVNDWWEERHTADKSKEKLDVRKKKRERKLSEKNRFYNRAREFRLAIQLARVFFVVVVLNTIKQN